MHSIKVTCHISGGGSRGVAVEGCSDLSQAEVVIILLTELDDYTFRVG